MRVFLAGIIQGSYAGLELHDQSYRDRLKAIFRTYVPDAETCCPIEMHPSGVDYDLDQQREAFAELVETASQADLLVAYLPEASLGTAIELWEAYHHGRPVVVITPMRENWVINLLAQAVFPTLDAFEAFVRAGGLADLTPPAQDEMTAPPAPQFWGEQTGVAPGLDPSPPGPLSPMGGKGEPLGVGRRAPGGLPLQPGSLRGSGERAAMLSRVASPRANAGVPAGVAGGDAPAAGDLAARTAAPTPNGGTPSPGGQGGVG